MLISSEVFHLHEVRKAQLCTFLSSPSWICINLALIITVPVTSESVIKEDFFVEHRQVLFQFFRVVFLDGETRSTFLPAMNGASFEMKLWTRNHFFQFVSCIERKKSFLLIFTFLLFRPSQKKSKQNVYIKDCVLIVDTIHDTKHS